jgi:outer membrane protein TolC
MSVLVLLPGCGNTSESVQPEVSAGAILERMTVAPESTQVLEALVTRPRETPVVPVEEAAQAGAVPRFSLGDAVAYALRNSPRLKVATASAERAGGEEVVAFAPFLPEVGWFSRLGVASPILSPGAPGPVGGILPSGLDVVHTFVQAEIDLQWTVWDFGRTSGRYYQAVSRQRIAGLQLVRAQQTVAYDVAAAYIGVLLAQASRVVQEQAIRQAETVLQDARARRLGGVAFLDDVLRAEVQLSEARENLVAAQEVEFNALARLNYAMGRNVTLPLQLNDWKVQPRFERSLVECLQNAAEQRQEVRIAQEAVAAAQYGLQAVEADFLPRIYIRSAVGHVDGSGIRTGWQEGAGIHFDQPFYAGGRRQGEAQAAAADVRAAAANAQTIFDTITLEVNLAFRGQFASRERIRLTEPAVRQARENLRLVRVKYQNGTATPTDVIDAETAATRSEERYYAAIYDYLTALARLEYAMGTPPGSVLEQSHEPQTAPAEPSPDNK